MLTTTPPPHLLSNNKTIIRLVLIILFLGLSAYQGIAQGNYQITGKVYDTGVSQWAEAAGVRLLTAKDSTLVKGVTTNAKGEFTLSGLKRGQYNLIVTFVGYEPYKKVITLNEQKKVNVGTICIKPNATALAAVEVTAQARPIIIKQDTVEFNAGSFKVQEGAKVEELLRQLPGVEVDADGNITYNGETIEKIEMDGRDFFASDPTMATRNLPSLMVDKVQVVDKKSDETRLTGMDDGTRTKILNLKIKPEMKKGGFLNLNSGYGTLNRYNLDFMGVYFHKDHRLTATGRLDNISGIRRNNGDRITRNLGLNYDTAVKDKLQLTVEGNYNGNTDHRNGKRKVESLLGDNKSNINNNTYNDTSKQDDISFNSRIQWTPDTLTSIYITPDFSFSKGSSLSQSHFITTNELGDTINSGNSSSSTNNSTISGNISVDARRRLNSQGRQIYLGLRGAFNQEKTLGYNNSQTLISNIGLATPENINQQRIGNNNAKNFSLNASYTEPLSKNWFLQLNYRLSMQSRNNDQQAYDADNKGEYTILSTDYSKGSVNQNRTQRIGIQAKYTTPKHQMYVGFDAIPTYTHTQSTIANETVYDRERSVWNYAPSVRFFSRPTDSLFINVRYRGNTSQPSLQQLNPALYIQSPLHTTQGNPDLLPAFSHNLNFDVNIGKPSLRTNIGLRANIRYTNNAVVEKRSINNLTGKTHTTYENVSGLLNGDIGIMGNTGIGNTPLNLFFFSQIGYNISKAFINENLNTSYSLTPMIAPTLSWNASNFTVSLGGHIAWGKVRNSIAENLNRNTLDYSVRNYVNLNLPWNIYLSSNLDFSSRKGYGTDADKNYTLWDTTIGKSFGTDRSISLELSVYDILGQRSAYHRNITASTITDTQINNITTYALLTLRVNLNKFGDSTPPKKQRWKPNRRRGPMGGGMPPRRIR